MVCYSFPPSHFFFFSVFRINTFIFQTISLNSCNSHSSYAIYSGTLLFFVEHETSVLDRELTALSSTKITIHSEYIATKKSKNKTQIHYFFVCSVFSLSNWCWTFDWNALMLIVLFPSPIVTNPTSILSCDASVFISSPVPHYFAFTF